jgi:hypothetical protein
LNLQNSQDTNPEKLIVETPGQISRWDFTSRSTHIVTRMPTPRAIGTTLAQPKPATAAVQFPCSTN